MNKKIIGGWSMSLTRAPLNEFDYMMYGMISRTEELTNNNADDMPWTIEDSLKPDTNPCFQGKRMWVYGGDGLIPDSELIDMTEVDSIVLNTVNRNWDGVIIDNKEKINEYVALKAMSALKKNNKATGFSFVAGYKYKYSKEKEHLAERKKLKKS